MQLTAATFLAADYTLHQQGEKSSRKVISRPDYLYKGKIKGLPQSNVRLTIKKNLLYGIVSNGAKEFFITPLKYYDNKSADSVFLLTNNQWQTEAFNCGYNPSSLRPASGLVNTSAGARTTGSDTCFTLPFISIADYSMFQYFNNDVSAVETAMLSALNFAEGAFTTLNLGTDASRDTGRSQVRFKITETIVSTCPTCDIVSNTEVASNITAQVSTWVQKNINQPQGKIVQFWTRRQLFDFDGRGIAGTYSGQYFCDWSSGELLRHSTDDPAFLRVLVAHETGHVLGCAHDDDYKPGVTDYIMYSSATGRNIRFSTLADFGGSNYSAHKTINERIRQNTQCLLSCQSPNCTGPQQLTVKTYTHFDSVQVQWKDAGVYRITLQFADSSKNTLQSFLHTGNRVSLTGLLPCTAYRVSVVPLCAGGTFGQASTMLFTTSSLAVRTGAIHMRDSLYDLEMNMNCQHCGDGKFEFILDGKPTVADSTGPQKFTINNLFADGARHKLKVIFNKATVCSTATIYQSPYYRLDASTVLAASFDGCSLPGDWKDTLLKKASGAGGTDARFTVGQTNVSSSQTHRGTFDSTCFAFYSSLFSGQGSGARALMSPEVDITSLKNPVLHFDYNFRAYNYTAAMSSIGVEIFNGTQWINIFKRDGTGRIVGNNKNLWDSIPQREFIDLEKYKDRKFKVRFIADDGSLTFGRSTFLFFALDNIAIDGYGAIGNANSKLVVFPNPALSQIFVKGIANRTTYEIFNETGQCVQKGIILQGRISVNNLTGGLYILRATDESGSKTVKFVHQ